MSTIRRALLSVSDKNGIVDFARSLRERGVEILSTGGTAKLLQENQILVTEVGEYTGFPEMMDGRLKTLHPKVHGGLLGRRGVDDAVMAEHGIAPIDLVAVNLYPFSQTVANPACTLEQAIENIDIGGPTMLRAAAKNYAAVTVVVDSADYALILAEMAEHQGSTRAETRFALARKVFEHTTRYDGAIANYLGGNAAVGRQTPDDAQFPHTLNLQFHKVQNMRYGENPHQSGAFYAEENPAEIGIARANQLQGKELSYNNVADTDAALECVKSFQQPACVIVKHANPCGVAVASDILQAYDRAYQTDPTSAFGGIIAFNRALDVATAQAIVQRQFVEVIIAPEVSAEALAALAVKPNVRVLTCGFWQEAQPGLDFKRVNGGLLVQDRDIGQPAAFTTVTRRAPTQQEMIDLRFAWKVVKFVKSNAIIYCRDEQTIGIGAGQMSRVYSAKIAGIKARDENLVVRGAVMASDAFFPFRDGLDAAAAEGITAVIQPGGSVKDQEVIAAADEHGIAMVFTGMRHFRH